MKKIKLFVMALAAIAIVSCSKEKIGGDNNEQPPVVEGVETYATFTFSVEGSNVQSKANSASETDAGTTTNQDKVTNIIVTIFKVSTPSVLEAVGIFKATDIGTTLTGDPMRLTSGNKRIFVFANADGMATFPTLTVGSTTLEDCYLTSLYPKTGTSFSLAPLTGSTGYYMSNTRTASSLKTLHPNISADASKLGKDDATNHLSFTLQKGVAKVKAKLATALGAIPATLTTPEGTISLLKYTVKNINTAVRPVQLFENLLITDTEAAVKEMLPMASYYTDFNNSDLKDINTFANKYSNLNPIDQTLSTGDNTNAVLATENTNAMQVYGNTSYLAVSCKYVPTKVMTACTYDVGLSSFTGITEGANTNVNGDFWKVDLTGLKHGDIVLAPLLTNNLFSSESVAKALLTTILDLNGIKATDGAAYTKAIKDRLKKYEGGQAYYRLNIGVTTPAVGATPAVTVFGIKRNSIYTITITKINKLGANTEDALNENPETPVASQNTYVTATIKVAIWVGMDQSGEL